MADLEEYEEGYLETRVTKSDGHEIGMFQMYPNFTDSLPIYFDREFTFACPDFPTTWSLQLTLERNPLNNDVSCEGSIKIIDCIGVSMNVDMQVRLVPPPGIGGIRARNLEENGMSRNHEVREIFYRFVRGAVLLRLDNLPVELRVVFRVRGCHEVQEMAGFSGEHIPPIA